MKAKPGRPRQGTKIGLQPPTAGLIEQFSNELLESGEDPSQTEEGFRYWLKRRSEADLWFFSAWILGNDYLREGRFHRDVVCPFLTDFSEGREKLLKLPMGHLKTTVASRSLPLHALIQPKGRNKYLPGIDGFNLRICLANETLDKSKENLSVLKTNCENNEWLYWLWPDIFYANPKVEANRWSDTAFEVKRTDIKGEPSVSAIGVNTGFVGRYYHIIIPDDLAALGASQSPSLLTRAKTMRKALRTRLVDKVHGIIVGVGTEWPAVDFYQEWEKSPNVNTLVKSIIEIDPETKDEVPLWPEHYPMQTIEKMRSEIDAIDWAAWYMNKPVGRGVTALDWHLLREYEVSADGKFLTFAEAAEDDAIVMRKERIQRNMGFNLGVARYDPMKAKLREKAPKGMDIDYYQYIRSKYPERIPDNGEVNSGTILGEGRKD